MSETNIAAAIAGWTTAIGPKAVIVDPASLGRYSRSSSFASAPTPLVALYPTTTEEVTAVVRVAARHRVPLHALSRGRNWGYGDAAPLADGHAIVDLSRMNRIIEVNRESAYAVVEAGVTQGQLWEKLRSERSGLWMDATGAGPEASLVGNALERGFGHTRYGDHLRTICSMEVVLADGRVIRTGFGHFPKARARWVFPYGVGPVLDGLFSQSAFGIVTQMGLWLMPEPESFAAFFFQARATEEIGELIERLAPLKKQGLLPSAVHVANDLRALSSRAQYPWKRTAGVTPMPGEIRRSLAAECAIGAWNGCGALTGPPRVVAAVAREVKAALRGFQPVVIGDRKLAFGQAAVGLLNRVGLAKATAKQLEIVRPVFEMLKGSPSNDALKGACWRVRGALPPEVTDPLEVGAGVIWVSPIVPQTGDEARRVVASMEPIYRRHGFDFLATLTLLTDRSLSCVTNIAFDRTVSEDRESARACHEELLKTLIPDGYIPYRASPAAFPHLTRHASTFWDVAEELKQTLDPHGILSPGRYVPARAAGTRNSQNSSP